MQNWFTQGKISSQIYGFLPLKHHSCIQEAMEKKLVDVWAVDSLQMWRETQTLETREGRFQEQGCEKGKISLKIQDKAVRICPVWRICRLCSLMELVLLELITLLHFRLKNYSNWIGFLHINFFTSVLTLRTTLLLNLWIINTLLKILDSHRKVDSRQK